MQNYIIDPSRHYSRSECFMIVLGLFLFFIALSPSAWAQQVGDKDVFFYEQHTGCCGPSFRMKRDGSNVEALGHGVPLGGFVYDPVTGTVYAHQGYGGRYVVRMDLDGSNLVAVTQSSGGNNNSFDLDPVNRKVYLADRTNEKIWVSDADGVNNPLSTFLNFTDPGGLQVAPSLGQVFFTSSAGVHRINTDGTGLVTLVSDSGAYDNSSDSLEVDIVNGKLYWISLIGADRGVRRADLDGNNVETLTATLSTDLLRGIDVDPIEGKIYIGSGSSVRKFNLDGTGAETIYTGANVRAVGVLQSGESNPELAVAPLIPAAELETVDVDVELTTNGASIAATAFSIDYDETCLSLDDTDGDADDIPDDMTFHVAGDFSVTVFHDLGDADGEIDVSITDLAPPIATLADGALLTITFTSTCEPAVDATILAPVGFSDDPSATFGDDLAGDVDGTTVDGSVQIWPGPRGDCNRNDLVTAADLIAEALEIFDGDGDFWADVVGSTFAGSPVGCDANDDAVVNAGDISCTILLIFGGTCGGAAPLAAPGDLDPRTAPLLGLKGAYRDKDGASTRRVANETLWLPVVFSPGAHAISSVAFSLDLAQGVRFDPFDGNGDGLPDAVRFGRGGRPDLVEVRYDRGDRDGELDLVLGDYGATFARGLLLEIALEPAPEAQQQPARFAETPASSFGNTFGQAVPGHIIEAKPGRATGRE